MALSQIELIGIGKLSKVSFSKIQAIVNSTAPGIA
jgi:hypothetical protein